ncbi:MAG TPA: protein kinase [Polyangiales bacterium]|nr:protein kinase [Polyangiales bacterium]
MALLRENDGAVPPRVLGGRWELVAPLATGGMGTLYVGKHLQTGRRAAIKVIERASPDALARFKLEASVSAQLNHPGIVDVFDADADAVTGSCFIAMELLEGRTLRGVMDDPNATPHQVLKYLVAALEPLVVAHERGFVHRDLKPENIFVLDGTAPARVKLLDFGIVAQQSDQRLTRVGTAMGTPHYMSPEQATSARDAGPASDIWSMGVMMYEAIRSEVPFRGETSHAVIIQACTCPHVPLDAVVPGVDPSIARLIDRCLSKEPAGRPANARALLDELRDLLRPNSLPAARPSVRPQRAPITEDTGSSSVVRPSLRTRSIRGAAHMLAASGVVCGISAVALPLAGLAAPGAALLCAAIGGGLLYSASTRMRSLKELASAGVAANHNATAVIAKSKRPTVIEHPVRGPKTASVKLDVYADLTCAISRRACQRLMTLRHEHADDIALVWRPYWDPERDHARAAAEMARAVFERQGSEVFWEFFDRIIATTGKVTPDLMSQFASESGCEMHGLRRALRAHAHRRNLQACREEAELLGVDQSPTVMINGRALEGEITEDRLHWAYVDAKSAVERRRVVELDATHAGLGLEAEEPRVVRAFLVRYRGARNAPAALRRTREQAYERACKLVVRAQMPESDFADIALRFADALIESEDLTARLNEAVFADAARALAVGQLSEPIECDEGYQVLQRVS